MYGREVNVAQLGAGEIEEPLTSRQFIDLVSAHEGDQQLEVLRSLADESSFTDLEPDMVYFAADRAGALQVPDLAIAYLSMISDVAGQEPVYHEKMGFAQLSAGDSVQAERAFETGVALNRASLGNWYGLVKARAANGRGEAALEAAKHIVDWPEVYGGRHRLAELLNDLANELHTQGRRAGLEPFYAFAFRETGDVLAAIRALEGFVASGREHDALEFFENELNDGIRQIPLVSTIVAQALTRLGKRVAARDLLAKLPLDGSDGLSIVRSYVSTFQGDELTPESAATILARCPEGLSPAANLLVRLRCGEGVGLMDDVLALPPEVLELLRYDALELGYELIGDGQSTASAQIFERLKGTSLPVFDLSLAETTRLFAEQRWEVAADLMADLVPGNALQAAQLRLKQFELACFQHRMEDAQALLPSLMEDDAAIVHNLPAIVRFLAEIKDWAGIRDAFKRTNLAGFRYEQTGALAFRAFVEQRKARELLDLIEQRANWRNDTELRRLRVALVEELARTGDAIDIALNDDDVALDPVAQQRLRLRRLLSPQVSARGDYEEAITLCTDVRYLTGAAVTAISMIEHCKSLYNNTRLMVVVDDDGDGTCNRVFSRIALATGCAIDCVPAAEVVDSAKDLSGAYGVFTAGAELASAAYFRIFFARHLAAERRVRRAVYLDADVLVIDDLEPLFQMGLRGRPIAARAEVDRPEVRRASALHGLKSGNYFNSGVLVFELTHGECINCLDETIATIGTRELMFHDQCALNIGFKDNVFYLPERFNRFVPPHSPFTADELTRGNDVLRGPATMLHFLDRPKPWNPIYNHPVGMLWLQTFERLMSMIGPDLGRLLLLGKDEAPA